MVCNPQDKWYFGFVGLYAIFVIKHQVYRGEKIYGRLDCPSALRWIAKGHYVKNRVFFKDEATAIAAGYRPCAVCMPNEYKKWKEKQNEKTKS